MDGSLTMSEPPSATPPEPASAAKRVSGDSVHLMTAALTVAEKIRTRYRAQRQRFSEAQYVLRPPDRLRVQAEALADYLDQNDSVLDVGCGTGYLCAHVQEMYGVRPCGVDVVDLRQIQIPFQHFDGTSIPFPNKAFDHVVLSEVLHHSHEPMALVKECCRVARRSIILFEDMPDGRLGKLILYLHVRIFARRYDYPFKAASTGDYRCALAWLCDNAPCVARIPQEPQWFTVYPRILFVCDVTNSVTSQSLRLSKRA
jgi:SAM-dependent methyltransferase